MLNTGNVPVYIDRDLLKDLDSIADAFESEQQGEFAEAIDVLNPIDGYKNLLEVKNELVREEYEKARNVATSGFKEQTPIRVAVEILAGGEPGVPRFNEEYTYPIFGVDDSSIWSLSLFLDSMEYVCENDSISWINWRV